MTIARRLIILVAVPILVLVGLGFFTRRQLAGVEERTQFAAETQVKSLAALGNLVRIHAELRVDVRSYLLAADAAAVATARANFRKNRAEVATRLRQYADTFVTDDKDRRLLSDYQKLSDQWIAGAEKIIVLEGVNREKDGRKILVADLTGIGAKLGAVASEWIDYNEKLATTAGQTALDAVESTRSKFLIALGVALGLSGLLGWWTFRRIVLPIRGLDSSVKSIANGDYAKAVPFTLAIDETGNLARSIDILKQTAATTEEQSWGKANAAKLSGELQGATSLAEFGQRLVSGLVPMLGGGVAGFFSLETNPERLQRIAGYGLAAGAAGADSFRPGEGLVGQCAQERKPVALDNLPPDYLRVASGLGSAVPAQARAWPLLSRDSLLGVIEFASFRTLLRKEEVLLTELLPVVAMSLEILQRNLRTQELLAQTQEQARQLEEQTEELTQSQEELLAQKEELLTQQQELTAQREHLKTSEERTRLILESSSEGIFGVDPEGRIVFANPATCRMLGYTLEELIGQPSHDLIHHHRPDGRDYPVEECPMFAAYKRGEASRVDSEFLWRKAGPGLPVEYSATPILKDGAIVGAVISFTDITERKRADQRQADQLAFRQALMDKIPYPLFYKGPDTRFLGCNQAYEKAFGTRSEELVGKRVLDAEYLPEADRIAYQVEDETVIANASSVQREMQMPFADGQIHDTLYSVSGFRLADGSPGGLVGTLIDVSDRKKVADLERFNRLAIGREQRILELKREVNAFAQEAGKALPYASPESS